MTHLPKKIRTRCLLLVGSGVLLSTLDSSMINVALPVIAKEFGSDISGVDLVVLTYLMIISISLVMWGRVADSFGKGRIYLIGLCLFAVGAAACGVSTGFPSLIFSRAVQACGAGMMMAVGPALIKVSSPKAQLGRALGMVGVATSCGLMLGPVLSGFLLSWYSWRMIFFISVPAALLSCFLALKYVLPSLPEDKTPYTFDWKGSAIWGAAVAAYVLMIKLLPINPAWSFVSALCTGAMIVILIRVERSVENPVFPLTLILRKYFWTASAASALSFCALFIIIVLTPFYLDTVLALSPDRVGLVMMALPVSLVIFSPLSGWLYDRLHSARLISTAGLMVSTGAVLLLLHADGTSGVGYISFCLAVFGSGQSIFLSPNSTSVLMRVDASYSGISSGVLATARNFGMMSGAGIAGTGFALFHTTCREGSSIADMSSQYGCFMFAQKIVFTCSLIFLVAAVIISVIRE